MRGVSPPWRVIHCRTAAGYTSQSSCVPSALYTAAPLGPIFHAAWKPKFARGVTQMRSRGTVPRTSVQADRQEPSTTTRCPESRIVANCER